ncbi:MAG: PIG-L family deacetylase [Alicyclobacillus sp.]|nr:PIG-L family deacetylase [Alicyclobacillus sp.]
MGIESLASLMPVPDLLQARRVLCIQPHPDDIDVACGGTVARLADAGAEVIYLTVTDGGAGTVEPRDESELAAIRQQEQRQAGHILGVRDYRWLEYRDADYLPPQDLQLDLIAAIREVQPDTVITLDPWLPYEAHPAHRNVGLCAAAAVLFSGMGNIGGRTAAPHGVSTVAFAFTARSNQLVDVTQVWERKEQAIRAHASQFPEATWGFYGTYFRQRAALYGEQAGCALAEALKVFTPMHLHCNVDAEWL